MIRLLLDQGLPRSTATVLNVATWDVVHVADRGMSRARDPEILDHARRENRVCVTLDADFHAILAVTNAAGPSVIRLRQEGLNGKAIQSLVDDLVEYRKSCRTRSYDYRYRRLHPNPTPACLG